MITLLLIGAIVLVFWLLSVDRRGRRLEAQVAALRAALQDVGIAVAETARVPRPDFRADFGKAEEPEEGKKSAGAAVPEAEPVAMQSAATPPPLPAKAQEAPARRRSAADLEKLVGANWTVILGGIAIALGALFLVRYSIEAGLLGPGARIAAGTLFSAALFAVGEWLRRRDMALKLPVFESADIPGILTGAGAIAAFGTLYAAHALYGFVGPAVAFVGLTAIGIASLLLSAIHGPKLAAIGLLGAYGAPLLVSSTTPNAPALAGHTLVVTAAIMTVSRLRNWLWLAVGGIIGSTAWAFMTAAIEGTTAGFAGGALLVGLAIIHVATFGWEKAERPVPLADRPPDSPAVTALALVALAFAMHSASAYDFPAMSAGLATGLVIVAAAGVWPSFSLASGAAAFIVVAAAVAIDLPLARYPGLLGDADYRTAFMPADAATYFLALGFLAVPVGGLAIWAARRAAATAPRMAGNLAISASVIAFLTIIVAYLRIAPFETKVLFGVAALALALLFVLLTELFTRARPDDWSAPAPAAFAVTSVALVSFALGVTLSKTWMPFGFALTAAGIAWVYRARPLRALPFLAIAASLLAALGLWASAPFPGEVIGTTPLLNRLVVIAGLPATAILLAGEILRRNGAERTGAAVTAIGLALLGFFVGLELRHWIHGGEIVGPFRLADMAAQTIAALGFAIGLQRVARYTKANVYDVASLVAGGLSAAMIAIGLFVVHNPLLTGSGVGDGAVLNVLLPAYLVTGALAGVVALMARPIRPRWYTLAYALLAGLLVFAYFTMMTRHAFQGSRIGMWHRTSDMEFWTYSAVWLVLGAALLLAGLFLKSMPLRLASAAVIALTICKVFLLDMTALTGALRAFSFIGLGVSLLAIGRFYQRILVRTGNAPPAEAGPPELPESDAGTGGPA
ncbi:DUF2339 domain-containing protein [Oricola nitratireducens]|uniref:DUF2339 domain-containing protein n=1 Tax=Oricola nitratireducens TaxID=2775868 RepID=UPI00186868D4|nr:DUF2339 domain-containing protein [Oricola nitratireducens]